jgi:hypothetical protein
MNAATPSLENEPGCRTKEHHREQKPLVPKIRERTSQNQEEKLAIKTYHHGSKDPNNPPD